jgi:hypothetical protein
VPGFLSPKQQTKRDDRDRARHIADARRAFRALVKTLAPIAVEVKDALPEDKPRQKRLMVKKLNANPDVEAFLDKWIGPPTVHPKVYSWRGTALYQIRDVSLGHKTLRDGQVELDKYTSRGWQAQVTEAFQEPLRAVIPENLRAFLPDTVEVNVDEHGEIQRITDRFVNEEFTLEKKIVHMRKVLAAYNKAVRGIKKDLKSTDEITKLSAIVLSIVMETGIRPGKAGNGKAVVDEETGESVFLETFGAVTLGPAHVKFVRDNFAELSFIGKKQGANFAVLTDATIIKMLKVYVDRALDQGTKYVFVTKKGVRYTYKDLDKYFKGYFKGLKITDLRKIKATRMVWEKVRDEQRTLYADIRAAATEESADLKERVAELIAQTLDAAIAAAQVALSHGSATTTRKNYINPEILLRFLSTGSVGASMSDAILKGKKVLAFDPQVFVNIAMAENVTAAFQRKAAGTMTLGDLLEHMEEELGLPSTPID